MKLIDILKLANAGYPDGYLENYYDATGERKEGSGDLLAECIVEEIVETFVDEGTDIAQLERILTVLEDLNDNLADAMQPLYDELDRLETAEFEKEQNEADRQN